MARGWATYPAEAEPPREVIKKLDRFVDPVVAVAAGEGRYRGSLRPHAEASGHVPEGGAHEGLRGAGGPRGEGGGGRPEKLTAALEKFDPEKIPLEDIARAAVAVAG